MPEMLYVFPALWGINKVYTAAEREDALSAPCQAGGVAGLSCIKLSLNQFGGSLLCPLMQTAYGKRHLNAAQG